MSLYGKGVEFSYKFVKGQSLCALEKRLKACRAEFTELYIHSLGIPSKDIRERDCLTVAKKGNSAVNR
jgi:hypothetical protein